MDDGRDTNALAEDMHREAIIIQVLREQLRGFMVGVWKVGYPYDHTRDEVAQLEVKMSSSRSHRFAKCTYPVRTSLSTRLSFVRKNEFYLEVVVETHVAKLGRPMFRLKRPLLHRPS